MLHVASRNLGPRPPLSFEVEAARARAAAATSTCVPVPDPHPHLAVRLPLPLQHPARMLQPQHGTPTPTISAAVGAATKAISDPHFPLRLLLHQHAPLL